MKQILLIATVLYPFFTFGQPPVISTKLNINSSQWQDTTAYLALYMGNQLKVTDTLKFNDEGKASLNKTFIIGQYELVFPDRSQHHLIINEKKIKLLHDDNKIDYSRSNENSIFDAFLIIQNEIDKKRMSLANDETKTIMLDQQLAKLESKRLLFITSLEKKLENTMVKKIINATCMPNDLGFYNANIELAKFRKRSFLEYSSPNDPSLYYTKIFHENIKFYLTRLNNSSPEQFLEELTWSLEKSKAVAHNYRYMVDFWLGYFQRSKKPLFELGFELIVRDYVLTGQAPWIEEWQQQKLESQIQFLKNQKLGDTPPTITIYSPTDEILNYAEEREKYQLLLFWDPHCGHCLKDVPEFARVYYKHRLSGFSVVAIYDQTDKKAWIEYIKEQDLTWLNGADIERKGTLQQDIFVAETPTTLLLDHQGKIIKKRLSPTELDRFLKEELY
ncbi:MAG: TlpA family protein disulfide reductase [Bacteroidia bacterium]